MNIRSMKAFSILSLLMLAPAYAAPVDAKKITPGVYEIDKSHSKVGFEVPHMVISSVEGRFTDFSGKIIMAPTLEKSSVDVTISTDSIDTGNEKRDEHLKSADFFDSSKFPVMTFKSKSVSGTPKALKIKGSLTIKGTTKEVELAGKYKGTVLNGMKVPTAAFEASTEINRKDYGLTYSKLVEAGPAVGDTITIILKVEANKVNEEKKED